MFKYMQPFYYTCESRLKTKIEKITYILTYICPVTLIIILNLKHIGIIKALLCGILSITLSMSLYEIGYIINDTISIKKEKNPTLRLEKKKIEEIQMNIKEIILFKIVISYIIYNILYIILKVPVSKYLVVIFLILAVYYIHNNFRSNKITYITFFLLSTLRFFTPIYLVINNNETIYIMLVMTIFLFAINRNIEEIGHKKYFLGNINVYKYRHGFRVIYYLLMLVIILYMNYLKSNYNLENIKILIYYLVLYRSTAYILLKLKEKKNG